MKVTVERLHEVLHYDPITGIFRWKATSSRRARAGKIAGSVGTYLYRRIVIDRGIYVAHHLAWLYMTGEWPKDEIDHRNLVKHDNRWENLREATPSQNKANVRSRRRGLKGVFFNTITGRYRAEIRKDGVRKTIGYFCTEAEAHAAYVAKAKELHGEFARAA